VGFDTRESIEAEYNQAYEIAERTGRDEDWRYYHEVGQALADYAKQMEVGQK